MTARISRPGDTDDARRSVTKRCALLALAISMAVVLGTTFDLPYPGRAAVTVGFAIIVPGWACVSHVGFRERLVEVTASICLSVSMGILLAMVQIGFHLWQPRATVAMWAAVTALALVPHLTRRRYRLKVIGQDR